MIGRSEQLRRRKDYFLIISIFLILPVILLSPVSRREEVFIPSFLSFIVVCSFALVNLNLIGFRILGYCYDPAIHLTPNLWIYRGFYFRLFYFYFK